MPAGSIHQGCRGRAEAGGLLAYSDVLVGAAVGELLPFGALNRPGQPQEDGLGHERNAEALEHGGSHV